MVGVTMDYNGRHYVQTADGAYMGQEEEWDREGMLDPAWEKQQKKVSFYFHYSLFLSHN
jgi:hypothetical protein